MFRFRAPLHGTCENLLNALEPLATRQMGADSPVEVLVEGLQERSRLRGSAHLHHRRPSPPLLPSSYTHTPSTPHPTLSMQISPFARPSCLFGMAYCPLFQGGLVGLRAPNHRRITSISSLALPLGFVLRMLILMWRMLLATCQMLPTPGLMGAGFKTLFWVDVAALLFTQKTGDLHWKQRLRGTEITRMLLSFFERMETLSLFFPRSFDPPASPSV